MNSRYHLISISFVGFFTNANASDIEGFVAACTNNTDTEPQICECMAQNAQNELSPLGFEFVVAALNNDEPKTEQLRSQMSPAELLPAGMFFVNGLTDCDQALNPE